MAFEGSDKTQTMLDMIKEFMKKEVLPIESELFAKGFNAVEFVSKYGNARK